ncbi:hypothetical protein ACIBCT_34000 [Streptosporangium sp. NPDC050855]|uniref:hypothetical protein n=1 Tax=Streptosporangium sp. NPDC050855 TaxID=3366194 RepID=UPI0037AA70CD
MTSVIKSVAAASAGLAAAAIGRRLLSRRATPNPAEWYALTIECSPEVLTGPDRPGELARLVEEHDVRFSEAPGGRGTEVAVRTSEGAPRERLRAVKQLIETGEVLRVEGQTEGRRTLAGRTVLPGAKRLMRRGIR